MIGIFVGLTLAILVVAILGVVILWFYGSFWTTAFFIFLGGDLFVFLCYCEHLLSVFMYIFLYGQLGICGTGIQICAPNIDICCLMYVLGKLTNPLTLFEIQDWHLC